MEGRHQSHGEPFSRFAKGPPVTVSVKQRRRRHRLHDTEAGYPMTRGAGMDATPCFHLTGTPCGLIGETRKTDLRRFLRQDRSRTRSSGACTEDSESGEADARDSATGKEQAGPQKPARACSTCCLAYLPAVIVRNSITRTTMANRRTTIANGMSPDSSNSSSHSSSASAAVDLMSGALEMVDGAAPPPPPMG